MKGNFLKILLASLVLMIALGAVSALEDTATDDVVSAEETEVVSVAEDDAVAVEESEAVAAESESEVIASENTENDAVAASDSDDEVLNVAVAEPEKLKVSSGDVLGAKYKTVTLGKTKIATKYLYYDKLPSKVQKSYNKQLKKLKKSAAKILKKYMKKNWKLDGDVFYDTAVKGKYLYYIYKVPMVKY